MTLTGRVIKIVPNKNFGFIESGGTEFFFHRDDFQGHWKDLEKDFNIYGYVEISFCDIESPKGPRATDVRRNRFPNEG